MEGGAQRVVATGEHVARIDNRSGNHCASCQVESLGHHFGTSFWDIIVPGWYMGGCLIIIPLFLVLNLKQQKNDG